MLSAGYSETCKGDCSGYLSPKYGGCSAQDQEQIYRYIPVIKLGVQSTALKLVAQAWRRHTERKPSKWGDVGHTAELCSRGSIPTLTLRGAYI